MNRLRPIEAGFEINRLVQWIIIFLVMFSNVSHQAVFAQTADPNNNYCVNPLGALAGGFSLDKTRICAGSAVAITGGTPNGLSNVGYIKQYSGKGLATNYELGPSFQYTQPGSYTILQVGSINGTSTISCKEVVVVPTDPINFTVKACSGRQVTLNITLDANTSQYDSYVIRWDDGAIESKTRASLATPPVHTYNSNGQSSYNITIYGVYNAPASCEGQRKTVNTGNLTNTASTPIINRLTTTGENTIILGYQSGSGTTVQLYQKDASGIYVATGQVGNGTSPFVVNTNTRQVQCFQVVAQDACNNAGVRSGEVCSIVLDAKAVNKQNDLSWTPYQGTVTPTQSFRFYRINRNGSPVGGTLTSQTAATFSDDNKIECGTPYCYTVEATVGPAVITSGPACVTGINSEVPSDFRNVTVSVEGNQPRLVMSLPTSGTTVSYTLQITRSDRGGSFQSVGSVTNRNTFIDNMANASSGSYCYQVTYQNNCGLTSAPSKPVCTVYLDSKSSNSINWTTDSPFLTGGVQSYVVEVVDSLNGTRREIQVGGNTRYEPDPNDPNLQAQKYRIIAVSSGGQQSYSNFFTFRREARILVPDAFTPNGDGMNDTFVVKGIFVDQFRISVYDRWGTVVFSSTDKNTSWDGTVNGQYVAAGQYMYRIEINDLTNQQTVRTGAVLLVR